MVKGFAIVDGVREELKKVEVVRMETLWILPLAAEEVVVERVGGKGANLARLARANFPVPNGFLVTTEAYEAYLAVNELSDWVVEQAAAVSLDDPAALEAASAVIRTRFSAGMLPEAMAEGLRAAYEQLGRPAVAVRSSATAEDLPEFSFAGQQDTFLNVVGEEALFRAVIDCWSSLWTARAIGYRARNGIPQAGLALAVVVQTMVSSEVSGVLFTANPITGDRTETVIDAVFGLGEGIVSGLVEPDHYVVVPGDLILTKTLGAKAAAIRPADGGGTVTEPGTGAEQQALPDSAIVELARLGRQVAALYGTPQDVEWAWANNQLYLLQARAITSLYPPPVGLPESPLGVLLSFGAVQGMLDPMTPLGRETLQLIFVIVGSRFGYRMTLKNQQVLLEVGERLFINVTDLAHNRFGRQVLSVALPIMEPGGGQGLEKFWSDPRMANPGPVRPRVVLRIAGIIGPIIGRAFLNVLGPKAARARIDRRGAAVLDKFSAYSTAAVTLRERVALFEKTFKETPNVIQHYYFPGVVSGMMLFQLLRNLAAGLPNGEQEVQEITRGMPDNVTTEMDLVLWATARQIQQDPLSAQRFETEPAEVLATDWAGGRLPPAAQAAVSAFMERYGMRGLAEIDMGRPRWREEPTPVFQVLQSYLQITDPELAPDAIFARGAAAAEAALKRLALALRRQPWGWFKAPLARTAGRRMRLLMGVRESPKFFVIRMMGLLREVLRSVGRELVAADQLAQPEDIFFLRVADLEALAAGERRDWAALVAERRNTYARELRRRQIPRILLGDGRAIFEGMTSEAEGEDELAGSPVSPGVVEGRVRVVLDPRGVQLQPGEILVCPGTDPSWTPLFLAAGGLVMEVGGLMTHGAVVAREYGIPAVVGVHQATTRLQTGQRIRVDGTTGRIGRLE